MGTTSVAQAPPQSARPVADPPLHRLSTPRKRHDESMADAVAGWYYDPDDQAVYRFWDGHMWTDRCSDVFPAGRPTSN